MNGELEIRIVYKSEQRVLLCRFTNVARHELFLRRIIEQTDVNLQIRGEEKVSAEFELFSHRVDSPQFRLASGETQEQEVEMSRFCFPKPGDYMVWIDYDACDPLFYTGAEGQELSHVRAVSNTVHVPVDDSHVSIRYQGGNPEAFKKHLEYMAHRKWWQFWKWR